MNKKVSIDSIVKMLKEKAMTRKELATSLNLGESAIYKILKNRLPEGVKLNIEVVDKVKKYSILEVVA